MTNAVKTRSLLIVDDSEMNRSLLCDILEDEYLIYEAENGLQAITLLERYHDEIDIVLLDLVMPVMDGFAVLENMGKNGWLESIPIIMISADNSPSSVDRAYALGVSEYISRPFDMPIIRHRVRNTVRLSLEHKKLRESLNRQSAEDNPSPVRASFPAALLPDIGDDSVFRVSGDTVVPLLNCLSRLFDVARVVDPVSCRKVDIPGIDGEGCGCYELLGRTGRCPNCVSLRAFTEKKRATKLECSDNGVCSIISNYMEVDGEPCVLELIYKAEDQFLSCDTGRIDLKDFRRSIYRDALTDAYNRRYYDERVKKMIRAEGIAMIDLDEFKTFNDTYGHRVGDIVLVEFTRAIRSCLKDDEHLIRYGGDEFVVVFPSVHEVDFRERLEGIRNAIHNVRLEECPDCRLTASIGGVYNKRLRPIADILNRADKVMYSVKRGGRDAVRFDVY